MSDTDDTQTQQAKNVEEHFVAIGERLEKKLIEHLEFQARCGVLLQPVSMDPYGDRTLKGPMPSPCDIPAVFNVWCRQCGKEDFVCAAHQKAMAAETDLRCGHCGAVGVGSVLMHFDRLPVGGAS